MKIAQKNDNNSKGREKDNKSVYNCIPGNTKFLNRENGARGWNEIQ